MDDSSYGHQLQARNVAYSSSIDGQALDSGRASILKVPEHPSLDAPTLTFELWIMVRSLPRDGARAGLIDNDGKYGMFLHPQGAIRCATPGRTVETRPIVRPNVWTSVACTADSGGTAVFVDGVEVARVGPRATVPVVWRANGTTIGSNNPSGDALDGQLDNVRIWRHVRSPEQLCAAAPSCP